MARVSAEYEAVIKAEFENPTDKHLLCGGESCANAGDHHCRHPCLVRKDISLGYVRGNMCWIACFVASSLNEKGDTILPSSKIKPHHPCPCGSGKKMRKCTGGRFDFGV